MIILLLIPISLTGIFLLSSLSTRINILNSVVINAPIGIFECNVPNKIEYDKVFYVKNNIQSMYEEYISNSFGNIVDTYSIQYRYYDASTQGLELDYPSGVDISISAHILLNYSYNRTMYYEIRGITHE